MKTAFALVAAAAFSPGCKSTDSNASPISDPGVGLVARWHDYFGTNPNYDAGGAPPEPQQWLYGSLFITKGTAGTALTSFESLVPTLPLTAPKPPASAAEACQLETSLVKTY